MSYNTRRSGGFGQGPPQQNVGSIGQRRPVVTNNFVPGGQLNQNKPGMQMPNIQQRPPQQQQQQQQQPPQQQQQQQSHMGQTNPSTNINFRSQQIPQNQGYQTAPPLPQQTPPQQPQVKAEPPVTPTKPPIIAPAVNPPNPPTESSNGDEKMEQETEEGVPHKKRPFWAKPGNKISKKEKMRRRNLRLSKMLQPKNAVMILNELVKQTAYNVEEISTNIKGEATQFRASVLVDEVEHVGNGRSKIAAKNAAAEIALKHLIKSNKLTEMKKDEEGNEKMDVSEDDSQAPLPWQHVASFALFKLFCSWGEDPNIVKLSASMLGGTNGSDKLQHENRPAKKMPANPETINPLMLINQMLPQAEFEEIGKSGNPPNVIYSYRCNVGDQSFIGTGPNKKSAKKLAAFGACHKVLEVNYPTDVYVPIY